MDLILQKCHWRESNRRPLVTLSHCSWNYQCALMCDLLQQLDFIYSLQDMNSMPCKFFKNITLITSFTSLGDGLAMFLILDEVLANIDHRKNYLSRFYKAISRKAALREMIRDYRQAVKDLPRLIPILEKQAHDKHNQSRSLARPAWKFLARSENGNDALWKDIAEEVYKDADRLIKMIVCDTSRPYQAVTLRSRRDCELPEERQQKQHN
ncbi:hypothetical protein C5167_031171 [Papaver somniferum]|nr:hypothetical protein C5167_031171 [Papaver somniferum]